MVSKLEDFAWRISSAIVSLNFCEFCDSLIIVFCNIFYVHFHTPLVNVPEGECCMQVFVLLPHSIASHRA
eukprot:g32480.t1